MSGSAVAGMPDVSVIVPTHNVGQWVGDCIESILDESEASIEVIVIDDRSVDETPILVEEIAERDPRVRLVRATGTGGAQARDLGVELARGEYIAFADGDDIVPQGAYSAMLRSARQSGSDLVVGRFFKFFLSRTWYPTRRWPAFDVPRQAVSLADHPTLIRNRACWNRLFRREWWVEEGITFPSVPRSNDIVPMTKALTRANSIDVVTDIVYLYRDRPGTTSMTSQAGVGEGVESYLSQEFESRALIEAVGSPELLAEYDELFAAQDGWVHMQKFLTAGQYLRTESRRLQRIQEWIQRMVLAQRESDLPGTRWEIRWAWLLMAEGQWDDAALIAKELEKPARERKAIDLEFWLDQTERFSESPFVASGLIRRVFEDQVPRVLAIKSTKARSERFFSLFAAAPLITQAFEGVDRRRLNASLQQILLMLGQSDSSVPLRSVPRVTVRSVVQREDLVAIMVEPMDPEVLLHLRLDGPDGAVHKLPVGGVDANGNCTATIPVAELGDEPLMVFAVISTPFGSVDYRLGVPVVRRAAGAGEELIVGTPERELWRVPEKEMAHGSSWQDVRVVRVEAASPEESESGGGPASDGEALPEAGEVLDAEQAPEAVAHLQMEVSVPAGAELTGLRLWAYTGGKVLARNFDLTDQEHDELPATHPVEGLLSRTPWTVLGTIKLPVGVVEAPLAIQEGAVVNTQPKYRIESRDRVRLLITRS